MSSSERSQLVQWFLPQLEKAWDDDSTGAAQVLGDRYVQWAGYGVGLQIECSSNQFLTGVEQLTAAQVAELRSRGWHDPAGEDLPNYWQVFLNREDLLDAARALARAVEVLKTPASIPVSQPAPQVPRRRGRTIVVVPVFKVSEDEVATAVRGALRALGPSVILDCFRLGGDELPPLSVRPLDDVLAEELPLSASVIADTGIAFGSEPFPATMHRVSLLLSHAEQLRAAGQDCLIIGPRLLPGRQWLYAAALVAEADRVVLALTDHDDGHVTWQLLLDVMAVLKGHDGVLAMSFRLEGSVLRALGELAAVVESGDGELLQEALGLLLDGHADAPWLRPDVREALYRAQLAPLTSRVRHLPPELETSRDADAAVQLVGELLTLVQAHLEHLQDAGFGELDEVRRLLALIREAGKRGIRGVEFAGHALRWIAECGIEDVEDFRAASQAVNGDAASFAARATEGWPSLPASSAPAHYVRAGTECASKAEFAAVLADWLDHPEREAVVGRPGSYGGKAVLRVEVDGVRFHLNGDTRDVAVRAYLALADGSEPDWHVIANAAGKVNKVAFGTPPKPLPYFYLYADHEAAEAFTV